MILKLEQIRQILDSETAKTKSTNNKFWREVAKKISLTLFVLSITIEFGFIVNFFRVAKNESRAIELMPEDD